MSEIAEATVSESYFGFCSGRGTMNVIFIVCQIIEKVKEHVVTLHLHYIGFKSVFDIVWKETL